MAILFTALSNAAMDKLLSDASSRLANSGGCFSEAEAWIWLYRKSAIKSGPFGHAQGVFQVQRGQLVFSYRDGQRFWGWGRVKTEGFLKRLQRLGEIQLLQQPHYLHAKDKPDIKTGITIVSICLINNPAVKGKVKYDSLQASYKPPTRQQHDAIKRNNEEIERRKASDSVTVKNGGDAVACGKQFKNLIDVLEKSPGPMRYRQPKD